MLGVGLADISFLDAPLVGLVAVLVVLLEGFTEGFTRFLVVGVTLRFLVVVLTAGFLVEV